MSSQLMIWMAFGISVFAFGACIWQFANMRGYKARGRRRSSSRSFTNDPKVTASRRSDRRKLSRQEKKLYAESQRWLADGKNNAAARILEQLGMQREAIQILEDAGHIHEAAKILTRMQRHNRAGVVYAQHGFWEDAAQAFKAAQMPLETAKCYREAGMHQLAMDYFEKVNRYEDAAVAAEQLGQLQKAARFYNASGKKDKAMQMFSRLATNDESLQQVRLQEDEIAQVVEYLGSGQVDGGLVRILATNNKLVEVILNLVKKGILRQASELLQRATGDIGPQLIAEVSYQDQSADCLADVFLKVANYQYAGMVLERLQAFEKAGEAFEKAENFERAIYCFERAGQLVKAVALRDKSKGTAKVSLPAPPTPFALATVGTESSSTVTFVDQQDETTAVVQKDAGVAQRSPIVPPIPEHGRFVLNFGDQHTAMAAAIILDEERGVFHRAKFFDDLDFDQKNKLWNSGKTLSFSEQATILNYNDEPQGIYVITKGAVACYRQNGNTESYIDQMKESETFGELWLLADQPTAVHFIAARATCLRVIDREAFTQLLDLDGNIARKLYKRFTLRLLKRLLNQRKKVNEQLAS